MDIYVNCDSSKEKTPIAHWYAIANILTSGVVAPDNCGKLKLKTKVTAQPGEFVFFVRKESMTEKWNSF